MLASLHHFQRDEVAQERVKIIQFNVDYGEAATQQGFGVSRQVVATWKKRLAHARGPINKDVNDLFKG